MRRMTHVYHCSPVSRLAGLRAHSSPKQGRSGVYVAPSFFDSVAWAISYVAHKKRDARTYRHLTIYRLQAPREIVEKAWRSNSWENELFIPDWQAKLLKMDWQKTFTYEQLCDIHTAHYRKRTNGLLARSDIERTARRVRLTNCAAKHYLEFKEKFADLAMRGGHADQISVRKHLRQLACFILRGHWEPEVIHRVDNADLDKVKEAATMLRFYLNLGEQTIGQPRALA